MESPLAQRCLQEMFTECVPKGRKYAQTVAFQTAEGKKQESHVAIKVILPICL